MLGHASVRTTALYWQNIHQEPDNGDIGPILVDRKPLIPNKKPIQQCNSLSTPKTLKKTPGMLINGISTKEPEKFLLNSVGKKSDQLKTNQPLIIVANKKGKLTDSEVILLAKIKSLENQLARIQAENNNLKSENQHLKALVQQFQQKTKTQIIQLTHF
ncbi:8762_t:CDS:2 [Paraglomus brasilianum]|uniref:8762_t:CDS:1 n=1 Tax=Paraglomus brasilianum TaxID=144538 RepID=A0A9N9E7W3_9GLOM|nr:8762_t:CDS:2 [Paraglomus brasilianum]